MNSVNNSCCLWGGVGAGLKKTNVCQRGHQFSLLLQRLCHVNGSVSNPRHSLIRRRGNPRFTDQQDKHTHTQPNSLRTVFSDQKNKRFSNRWSDPPSLCCSDLIWTSWSLSGIRNLETIQVCCLSWGLDSTLRIYKGSGISCSHLLIERRQCL